MRIFERSRGKVRVQNDDQSLIVYFSVLLDGQITETRGESLTIIPPADLSADSPADPPAEPPADLVLTLG